MPCSDLAVGRPLNSNVHGRDDGDSTLRRVLPGDAREMGVIAWGAQDGQVNVNALRNGPQGRDDPDAGQGHILTAETDRPEFASVPGEPIDGTGAYVTTA